MQIILLEQNIKSIVEASSKRRELRSEKGGKKPKSKQPTLNAGKIHDKLEKNPLGYNDDEYYNNEEEYNEDDFM